MSQVLVQDRGRDELLRSARDLACRGDVAGEVAVLELRAGGQAVKTDGRRGELLAKLGAGELVEVEIDFLAYEQMPGKLNRKAVRFRDGALVALGRSGRGTPFLRDHAQRDLEARAGTVIASVTEKVGDGHYQIRQTARVTAPWAVEALLRGNLDRFSIGWNPTGDVLCSACNKPVYSVCYHYPGDRLREQEVDGAKKLVRDRAGSIVVEWVFTDAELVETSAVNVPAVPSTQIEGIRAALCALDSVSGGDSPPEEKVMEKLKVALVALLGLAATASDDEVITAVKTKGDKLNALEAQNAELTKLQARLAAEAEAARVAIASRELEEFIAGAVKERKLIRGSAMETSLRAYWQSDKDGATKLLESMLAISPVGEPGQRDKAPPAPGPQPGSALAAADERIRQHSPGASVDGVSKVLAGLGFDKAAQERVITNQLAPKKEV